MVFDGNGNLDSMSDDDWSIKFDEMICLANPVNE